MSSRMLPVPEGLDGQRLDIGLARMLGLSRSKVAELAARGEVRLDGRPLGKSDRLAGGSVLEIELEPPPHQPSPPLAAPGMAVVYADDDVVVVDKPVGVAAHPSPGWTGPTVLGGLAAAGVTVSRSGPPERQGVVHRLDAGTSGLMMVAKSDLAYRALKRAFAQREVRKIYHAVLQGLPDPLRGTIDGPIGRHPAGDGRWAVTAAGKPSVTHYDVLEAFGAASLCEIRLETGRTHQIRVHAAAVGHPCVGDLTYGADPSLAGRLGLARQWLHAHRLEVAHPATRAPMMWSSDYPEDLAHALEVLRQP